MIFLIYYFIQYSILASMLRKLYRFHYLIHFLIFLFFSTYLYYKTNIKIFSLDLIEDIQKFGTYNDLILFLCAQYSISYFLNDFIDIFLYSYLSSYF